MAFATVDDVQARARWTLTEAQRSQAEAYLDDAAAEIAVHAPRLPDDSPIGLAISCQAVLRALRADPGLWSKTLGQASEVYAREGGGGGIALTSDEIASLARSKRRAFTITPYVPPCDEPELIA